MNNPRYEDNDDAYGRHVDIEMAEMAERKELLALLYDFWELSTVLYAYWEFSESEPPKPDLHERVKAAIKRLEGAA